MLNLNLYFAYLAWSEGKALPSVLSDITGLSDRTCRRPLSTPLSAATVIKVREQSRARNLETLKKSGFSSSKAEQWLAQHPQTRSPFAFYSSLVYELQVDGIIQYPLTLQFAGRVDDIFAKLNEKRGAGDLEGLREYLLSRQQVEIFFRSTDIDGQSEFFEDIESASNWDALTKPIANVSVNCLLSFLAMWDVEFSTQVYFRNLEPKPVFAMTLPQVRAQLNCTDGTLKKRRDMFRYPVRRLIDLMACIRFSEHQRQKAHGIPRVKDMAMEANIPEQNLINWRDGTRKLTRRDFAALWLGLYRADNHSKKAPQAPWPIFVATTFWQNLLVSVDTNSRDRSLIVGDEEYFHWWSQHYEELKAGGCTFGTAPWPDNFSEI